VTRSKPHHDPIDQERLLGLDTPLACRQLRANGQLQLITQLPRKPAEAHDPMADAERACAHQPGVAFPEALKQIIVSQSFRS
jgi:hypothetical protein